MRYKKFTFTKVIFASFLGNTLEFYDYALYGLFIPLLIPLFFPISNYGISLLYSLSVFAAGFLMRPVGSIVLGYIGDRYGRVLAFEISIFLMFTATLGICILPTYAEIGIYAPLLLVLCRLIQGFSCGAEYVTSFVYTLEHARPHQKGFMGSIIASSQIVGFFLGTGAYYIILRTSSPSFNWRFAFFAGGFIGILVFFSRLFLQETPEYLRVQSKKETSTNSFVEACQKSLRTIIMLNGLTVGLTGIIYTVFVYLQIFFKEYVGWDLELVTKYSLFGQFVCGSVTVLSGYFSDKLEKRYIMLGGLMFGCLSVIPTYNLLLILGVSFLPLFYTCIGASLGACIGPWCTLVNDLFPVKYKLSGISLGFSISQALSGGLTPLILSSMLLHTHNLFVPAYYLLFCFFLGALCLFFLTVRSSTLKVYRNWHN